ncbi:hypothetical protein NDU88_006532 [Pleurodeles waltl]|uniref:Uncharacterized protein n=1 Tax=Pleurodeles waltl TaxID=8319 RepID=A0AAV7VQ17_PLEWA|nr:hypothetical protein NDU88_006532 [Pleurodeles waltl]
MCLDRLRRMGALWLGDPTGRVEVVQCLSSSSPPHCLQVAWSLRRNRGAAARLHYWGGWGRVSAGSPPAFSQLKQELGKGWPLEPFSIQNPFRTSHVALGGQFCMSHRAYIRAWAQDTAAGAEIILFYARIGPVGPSASYI